MVPLHNTPHNDNQMVPPYHHIITKWPFLAKLKIFEVFIILNLIIGGISAKIHKFGQIYGLLGNMFHKNDKMKIKQGLLIG